MIKKIAKSAFAFGLLAITTGAAFAADLPNGGESLGTIAGNITDSLKGVTALAEAIAYVAGFFLALASLFKFKAYRDNPQQTPIGTPITLLAVAVCLVFLPSVFGSGAQTIWGGDAQQVTPFE